MRLTPLALIALITATPALAATETRCGWYNNPTPGNVFLKDADGFWWISKQGTRPAPGFDDAYTPAFDERERVVTNTGSYGHSCACAEGTFGPVGSMEVRAITRLKALPIAQCEDDPNLSDSPYFGE